MGTVVNRVVLRERIAASMPGKDLYFAPRPWMLVGITLLPFALLFVWLVVAYLGIEYGAPTWNSHSVPPPQLY